MRDSPRLKQCAWPAAALLAAACVSFTVQAAPPLKILRTAYPSAERGFDCAAESDEVTGTLCDNIFDALLQYDHLARPIKLQPRAAASMPEVSDNGATYKIRIKSGVYFTDDPVFKGKKLPLVDRAELHIIDEDQPRWLAFLKQQHEYIRPIPELYTSMALSPDGKLKSEFTVRGITQRPDEVAWITYAFFNMNDPVVGGYTPDKIALRRAISLAYPVEDEIAILEKGSSIKIWSHIAPGMAGYTPERTSFLDYDPPRAKALLDMYGYIDRDGDGWRDQPDGSPLIIDHASIARQKDRQRNELWQHAMDAIGIRMTFNKVEKLPELRKQAQLGKIQMWNYGWIADYPDGENFLQLFWSKSIGGANYTWFNLPEYDRLYEKAKTMPDSPERTELYRKMVRLLWVYNPWRVNFLKQGTILIQPWLLGYKKHPFQHEPWRYVDIDLSKAPKQ